MHFAGPFDATMTCSMPTKQSSSARVPVAAVADRGLRHSIELSRFVAVNDCVIRNGKRGAITQAQAD
jgi:hypothetical protein